MLVGVGPMLVRVGPVIPGPMLVGVEPGNRGQCEAKRGQTTQATAQ